MAGRVSQMAPLKDPMEAEAAPLSAAQAAAPSSTAAAQGAVAAEAKAAAPGAAETPAAEKVAPGSAAAAPTTAEAAAAPETDAAGPCAEEEAVESGAPNPPSGTGGQLLDEERWDLPLVTVLSFLCSPVRRCFFAVMLDGDVAVLRSQVAKASGCDCEEIVLGAQNRILVDGISLREGGVAAETEVTATRRVRGGGDSEADEPGWVCRECSCWNRAGLECYQCGTANPLLQSDGETSSRSGSFAPDEVDAGGSADSPPGTGAAAEPGALGDSGSPAGVTAAEPAPPPGLAAVLTADGQLWVEDGGAVGSEHDSEVGSDDGAPEVVAPVQINGHHGPRRGDVVRITVEELLARSEPPEAESGGVVDMPTFDAPMQLDPVNEAQLLMRLLSETLMHVSPPVRSGWIVRAMPEVLQLVAAFRAAAPEPTTAPGAGGGPRGAAALGPPDAAPPATGAAFAGQVASEVDGGGPLANSTFGSEIVAALIGASRGVQVGAILEAIEQPADAHPDAGATAGSGSSSGPGGSGPGGGPRPGGTDGRDQQHDGGAALGQGGGNGSTGDSPSMPPPAAQGP